MTSPATAATPVLAPEYREHVNPQWVRLLNLLQMNASYDRCTGTELHTADGRTILDFLSGYCVHNTGHNHPRIIDALKQELDRQGPAMLQSHVPDLAGRLAQRLCRLAGGDLNKAFFACSGSEGVESAIKIRPQAHGPRGPGLRRRRVPRAHLRRAVADGRRLLARPLRPMLANTAAVKFGDLAGLEKVLATRRYAAYFVEPVQSEAGIVVPEARYLREAVALCRRHGTLFVLDEVQTGMFRTGRFLAAHHFDVQPDMVILAKPSAAAWCR